MFCAARYGLNLVGTILLVSFAFLTPSRAAVIGTLSDTFAGGSSSVGPINLKIGYDLALDPLIFDVILSGDGMFTLNSGSMFSQAAAQMTNGISEPIQQVVSIVGGTGGGFQSGGEAFYLFGDSTGASGTDLIGFSITSFILKIENFLVTTPGTQYSFDWTIEVEGTVVPLPAALPLFSAALAGLGFFGWRRKNG